MDELTDLCAKPRRRRRWLSYSLRTLLLVTTMAAAVLGVWVSRAERQRRAVAAIREGGGSLGYVLGSGGGSLGSVHGTGGGSLGHDLGAKPKRDPHWLCGWLGRDYLDDVLYVRCGPSTTDAGLAYLRWLPRLEWLSLGSAQVGDAGMVHLRGLTNLTMLDLKNTQVADAGIAHLGALTSLIDLDLSNTRVSDAGMAHLSEVTKLKDLDLSNTQISNAGLAHLSGLANLERLDVSNNQIGNPGLVHLRGLTKLAVLKLQNTQVSDAGVMHLRRLTKLELVDLTETEVSDAGCDTLSLALPRCVVFHSSKRLEGWAERAWVQSVGRALSRAAHGLRRSRNLRSASERSPMAP